MSTRLLTLAAGTGLHLTGDLFLQLLLSRLGLSKTISPLHFLLHCATAEAPAFALIGYLYAGTTGAIAGAIVGTCAHAAIDLFGIRGSVFLKAIDQGLHCLTLLAYALWLGACYAHTPMP